MVVTTAGGITLAKGGTLGLREKELAPVLEQFHRLAEAERRPVLPDPTEATPAQRPVPSPPADGLVIRGYCTYLEAGPDGRLEKTPQFYYKENPDAWAAETQNDMLWLTREERESLVPADARVGMAFEVNDAIQERFFSTIGIDYMEGSVNALRPAKTNLRLSVTEVTPAVISMTLRGEGHMGVPFSDHQRDQPRSRGCHLRVLGKLEADARSGNITRFDVVGVGKAWGNKMEYTKREIRIEEYPWTYGIACELVTGKQPIDLIPPYNLLHYGSGLPYFRGK